MRFTLASAPDAASIFPRHWPTFRHYPLFLPEAVSTLVTHDCYTRTHLTAPRPTGRPRAHADRPDYDAARTEFYGGADWRPAAVVRARTADDVAATVILVRGAGASLAVRGGGHSIAHHSMSDGGIVLDLSAMKALQVDPERRTAWAEAGLTAGELLAGVSEHGLVIGFGDTGTVGIAGITLGGGIGYLSRLHGLTIDNVLAADVVTADGELVRADADSHPDLFWAIRGGEGNFGVVTRFHYRLHELPTVDGGMLVLPATPRSSPRSSRRPKPRRMSCP